MVLYCGKPECGLNRGHRCVECDGMRNRLRWFHNALRILINIDANEFPGPDCDWVQFRDDPWRYFIRTDDETAERLYRIVEDRKAFPV